MLQALIEAKHAACRLSAQSLKRNNLQN